MTKTELRAKATELLEGEVTFTKVDFCLIGLICLMAGICIGLLTAPFTQGVSICSNNGNNNGNNNGHNANNNNGYDDAEDTDVPDAARSK